MGKSRTEVVAQFPWTAVVKVRHSPWDYRIDKTLHEGFRYDIMEWNLYKLRWGAMSKARGFGNPADATPIAQERSDEIEAMLQANRSHPPALVPK